MTSPSIRRRTFVVGTSLGVVTLAAARHALAAKAQKADFGYRESPRGGKSCASCRLFTATGPGKGSCAVVEGDVSPSGWCMAYSPRPQRDGG
jgi:hypothetical protein